MIAGAIVASLIAIGAGGLVALQRRAWQTGIWIQAAGAAALAVSGFVALGTDATAGSAFTSAFEPRLGIDGLTAFFLATLGVIAAPSFVFSTAYLEPCRRSRVVSALTALFVLTIATALCARDPLTFLAAWELMTLVPAAIILVARNGTRAARRTVFTYVSITHLGGAGTWIAVLLLAGHGAFGGGETFATGSGTQIAVAIAALVGMGTKSGVMPLHVWLPRAHPMAPAPVSALMSGVMIKTR